MPEIRIAIAGIGNCASALLQGIEFYRQDGGTTGLIYPEIGGFKPADVRIVAAFDVDARKVGKDVSEAVWQPPNCTHRFHEIPRQDVPVLMGPVLDGAPEHLRGFVQVANVPEVGDVAAVLKETRADLLVNLLPTGSAAATRAYADAAIKEAKVGFINGIPELIASDRHYSDAATENRVPLVGDDFKSQIGTTVIHQSILRTLLDRGVTVKQMYQYNFAGNTDFANLERRGESKEISKRSALSAVLPYPVTWGFAPMYIEGQEDTKTGVIRIKGVYWGNQEVELSIQLAVNDSADAAGVMIDMIRFAKAAAERGVVGVLDPVCSFYAKHPPGYVSDVAARAYLDNLASRGPLPAIPS